MAEIGGRAAELIRSLALSPHPEGGYFREIFRSPREVAAPGVSGTRSALTTIYYLVVAEGPSRWHVVRSDEVWHHVEGATLELYDADPVRLAARRSLLGPAVAADVTPVHVVPAGHWQAARTTGSYTLAGCTVGPGFDYADFALLRDDPAEAERFRRAAGPLADLI
ncbi:MAG TPA: cupin domain-containing protein [Candidatus Eisenbacteria bacterium]